MWSRFCEQYTGCVVARLIGCARVQIDRTNMRLRARSMRADGVGLAGVVLVACPVSLVGNWKYEIETWLYLNVAVLSKDNVDELMRRCRKRHVDVVIGSFEGIRKHYESMDFLREPLNADDDSTYDAADHNETHGNTTASSPKTWHMLVVDEVGAQ